MNAQPTTTPLVSVVIPFYNVAAFLPEAVESVIDQSYADWELILVNDGSVDESGAIAQEFARKEPARVRCIGHEGGINKGASASRNVGLAKAKGEWIAFLDADDRWVSDKLEHQVGLAEAFPSAAMLCGSSLYWRSWSDPDGRNTHVSVGCLQDILYQPPELLRILYPLGDGAAPCVNGLLVRRSAAETVGGFVDEFAGMYDDQVFLTKVYATYPVYVSGKVYDYYRQNRPDSICNLSAAAGDYQEHRRRYLLWLRIYLRERGLADRDIEERVAQELKACGLRVGRQRRKGSRVTIRIKKAWKRLVNSRRS